MSAVVVTAVFHPREGRKQELADAMRGGRGLGAIAEFAVQRQRRIDLAGLA